MNGDNKRNPLTQRERHAQMRHRQLIDTALRLFAERGLEKTTIKAIAEAAGVAQGLIYHYFPSKEALFFAVLDEHGFLPQLREILGAPHDRPVREVLAEIAVRYYTLLREKEAFLTVVMREALVNPGVQARLERLTREAVALLARYLAARIAAGELRPHHPEVVARMLLSSVFMLHIGGMPVERVYDLVDVVLEGIVGQRAETR